jgi:hypothetical protein
MVEVVAKVPFRYFLAGRKPHAIKTFCVIDEIAESPYTKWLAYDVRMQANIHEAAADRTSR